MSLNYAMIRCSKYVLWSTWHLCELPTQYISHPCPPLVPLTSPIVPRCPQCTHGSGQNALCLGSPQTEPTHPHSAVQSFRPRLWSHHWQLRMDQHQLPWPCHPGSRNDRWGGAGCEPPECCTETEDSNRQDIHTQPKHMTHKHRPWNTQLCMYLMQHMYVYTVQHTTLCKVQYMYVSSHFQLTTPTHSTDNPRHKASPNIHNALIHSLTHRNLHKYTGTYTNTQEHTQMHRNIHKYTGTYTNAQELTQIHRNLHKYTGTYSKTQELTQRHRNIHRHTGTYTKTQEHTQTHRHSTMLTQRTPLKYHSVLNYWQFKY